MPGDHLATIMPFTDNGVRAATQPGSAHIKDSATIRPCPATSAPAWSSCRTREVIGS